MQEEVKEDLVMKEEKKETDEPKTMHIIICKLDNELFPSYKLIFPPGHSRTMLRRLVYSGCKAIGE